FVIAVAMNYVWEVTQRKLMVNQVLVGGRVFVSAPMRDAPSVLCEISDRRLYKPEMRDASAEPQTVGRRHSKFQREKVGMEAKGLCRISHSFGPGDFYRGRRACSIYGRVVRTGTHVRDRGAGFGLRAIDRSGDRDDCGRPRSICA